MNGSQSRPFDLDALRIDPADPTLMPRERRQNAEEKVGTAIHPLSVALAGPAQSDGRGATWRVGAIFDL